MTGCLGVVTRARTEDGEGSRKGDCRRQRGDRVHPTVHDEDRVIWK
jgi:hypothetical protein